MGADEYREFARTERLRFERFMREFRADSIRRHEAAMAALRSRHEAAMAAHDEVMRKLDEESAKTAEIIAEGRAQRAALFQILDRLNGGGGAEPAT